MFLIETNGLTKRYGDRNVVDQVNMQNYYYAYVNWFSKSY